MRISKPVTIALVLLATLVVAPLASAEDSPSANNVRITNAVPRACLDNLKAESNGWLYECTPVATENVWNFYESRNFSKQIFTAKKTKTTVNSSNIAGYFVKQDTRGTRERTVRDPYEVNEVALADQKEVAVPQQKSVRWEYVRPRAAATEGE